MPIPKPKENETDGEFISRCVSDSSMVSEYPDQKQRIAICYSQLKYSKRKSILNKRGVK
jgi:hypothetical protein